MDKYKLVILIGGVKIMYEIINYLIINIKVVIYDCIYLNNSN